MHSASKHDLDRYVACSPPFPLLLKVLHIGSTFSSEGLSSQQLEVILKKSVTGKKGQRTHRPQKRKISKWRHVS